MPHLSPQFGDFLALWQNLPRRVHKLLPCRHDITPAIFGEMIRSIGFAEMVGFQNLHIFFAGSEFERTAGLEVAGRNYYDLLPPEFIKPMTKFHETLLGTPCGAYIDDIIQTTSGSQYSHENIQLPVTDNDGTVKYLLAYGLGRKPMSDLGTRTDQSHRPSNIRTMFFIDLGAGAPTAHVDNYLYHNQGTEPAPQVLAPAFRAS